MKVIAIVISLACLGHGALAEDLATPSPTPVYLNHLGRPGSVRRLEQIDRRRAIQAESESRAQAKASRRSTAAVQAQAREATRAREQAQRQLAVQNRIEARKETPRPNSELMTRMGFSEQEIAAQKAREEPEKPDPGRSVEHPTPSPVRSNGAATPRPASASPAADPGS